LTSDRKRPIDDIEQTLLKIRLPDVNITSNRLVLSEVELIILAYAFNKK